MHVIGDNAQVDYSKTTRGKHSPHHDVTVIRMNNCHLAKGVHKFVMFVPNSDFAIFKLKQETRVIGPGCLFLVLK